MSSEPRTRAYALTWAALLALLAATFGLAHLRLGVWNPVASLAIAAVKALLVACIFMRLRRASALVALFAAVGLVMLAILLGLSFSDYATRTISPAPWLAP
jgi:cytochrome c oxidase subunit 4